jgi:RNA polymerase sigma-70 factor (ECF subfamily)
VGDRALNKRFRDGDDQAVREVYEQHGRTMFVVAQSVLHDRDLASECVQLSLVKAWRTSQTFDVNRELQPWLATITRRTAIDLYRERERSRKKTQASADSDIAVMPAGLGFDVYQYRPSRSIKIHNSMIV